MITGIPLMFPSTIVFAASRTAVSGLTDMTDVVMMSAARIFISFEKGSAVALDGFGPRISAWFCAIVRLAGFCALD
ncbi:hypothetical protein NK8_71410 (plasmid) [Caballeronia sp. NK8]|nr:hypothetical protein NK8_71410 [Caballeronia sp. NK8]